MTWRIAGRRQLARRPCIALLAVADARNRDRGTPHTVREDPSSLNQALHEGVEAMTLKQPIQRPVEHVAFAPRDVGGRDRRSRSFRSIAIDRHPASACRSADSDAQDVPRDQKLMPL